MTGAPAWAWAASLAVICGLLAVDMLSTRRQPGLSRTVVLSIAWVAAGIGFGLILVLWQGFEAGQEYFAAYLIEKSLSVDNLFVFLLVFTYFKVRNDAQHRLLYWGVLGAFILRATLITAGTQLVSRFTWLLYLFGGFLLWTAYKLLFTGENEEEVDPEKNKLLQLARRWLPIAKDDLV